ncbi:MAG: hypothetical protein ACJ757_12235 [Gaiellaceae bacterium]
MQRRTATALGIAKAAARRPLEKVAAIAARRDALADRTSPATKAALRSLYLGYRRQCAVGEPLPSVWETGLRVFSQFDEDGIALFLLAVLGTGTRRFVDIGGADGLRASNTANLALNFGFDGVFVDARESDVAAGKSFYESHPDTAASPPQFVCDWITRENVNSLVSGAGFTGEVDLVSIDVDGNDYWIWEALECVEPRLVVIETHTELGLEDFVAPYDARFDWRSAGPGTRVGASPVAMTRLAAERGYVPVGANLYGFNVFYARQDLVGDQLPVLEPAELFRHGSYLRGATP